MEYEFKNKKSGKIEIHEMRINELDSFIKKNSHLERYISKVPNVNFSGITNKYKHLSMKGDSEWRDIMRKIHDNTPESILDKTTDI